MLSLAMFQPMKHFHEIRWEMEARSHCFSSDSSGSLVCMHHACSNAGEGKNGKATMGFSVAVQQQEAYEKGSSGHKSFISVPDAIFLPFVPLVLLTNFQPNNLH